MKKSFYKSLWLNFIYLLLCLAIAAIATWFTGLYMKRPPSSSSEGSGWAGMADALSFGVMAIIYLVLTLVFWTILIFRQSASHRNPLFYISVHLLMLVIVVFIYISLLLQS